MTALMSPLDRLAYARLMMIAYATPQKQAMVDLADAAFAGGVDLLQLRLDDLEADQRPEIVQAVRSIAYQHNRGLVVRDDLDLARNLPADLVHLSAGSAADARKGLPAAALVGRSAGSVEAVEVAMGDADVAYVTVSPAVAGGEVSPLITQVAGRFRPYDPTGKPWFAQGGVTAENLDALLEAGVRRVVVGSALVQADDVQATATRLSSRLQECWEADEAMQSWLESRQPAPLKFPGQE